MIDLAKLLVVVGGATLLGFLFVTLGFLDCYNSPNGNKPNHRVKTSQITEQNYAKRREDGVYVVPIGCLRD